MSRITKPVEERRQEIIDTAHAMFIENGFEKTQMADISKRLNVAAGTIYHYFKSKTELLYAVIDQIADEKMIKKNELLNNAQLSAIDRIKLLIPSFHNIDKQEELNISFDDDPALIQYYLTKLNNSFMLPIVSLIEQGNKDGSWKCEYPKETAIFILNGMLGVMNDWHQLKEPKQEKLKKIKAYTKMVFRVLDIAEFK